MSSLEAPLHHTTRSSLWEETEGEGGYQATVMENLDGHSIVGRGETPTGREAKGDVLGAGRRW